MAKIFLFFLFFSLPFCVFSQENDELRDIFDLPKNDCEKYSAEYSNNISGFGFNDIDSIAKYLDFWIQDCGYNEAVFRVFILISIQEGNLKEEELGANFEYFLNNYEERIDDAHYGNHKDIFEKDEAYYVYIPLRSDFDAWTKRWASSLIKQQDWKGLDLYFLKFYSSDHNYSYKSDIENSNYDSINFIQKWRNEKLKENKSESSLSFGIGTWVPLGSLSDFFDVSPYISGMGQVPVSSNSYLELGGSIRFPMNKKEFRITTIDSFAFTGSNAAIEVYVNLGYTLWENRKYKLSSYGGFGVDFLTTQVERPIENEEEEPGNYSITTYNINLGLDFSRMTKRYNYWGIRSEYVIMDYNNGIIAADDLSGNAMRIFLYYRF